jgi:hypothetical protein
MHGAVAGGVDDFHAFYAGWMTGDSGAPFWPYLSNVQSYFDLKDAPNVLLVHFHDLKTDLEGQIRRVADFLEIGLSSEEYVRGALTPDSPTPLQNGGWVVLRCLLDKGWPRWWSIRPLRT